MLLLRSRRSICLRARRTSDCATFVNASCATSCDTPRTVILDTGDDEYLQNVVGYMEKKHVQVRNVARRAQVCLIPHTPAHEDPLPLRYPRNLARGRPPVPLRPRSALAPAREAQRGVALASQRTDVPELEDGAILERRADERVLEVER